jgi:hypothetical protein
MAKRFGFRLAKAREGSQHLGMPVRYLLKDNDGVILFRSLEEVAEGSAQWQTSRQNAEQVLKIWTADNLGQLFQLRPGLSYAGIWVTTFG